MKDTVLLKIRTGSGPDYAIKVSSIMGTKGFEAIEKAIHFRAKQYVNQNADIDYEDIIEEALKSIGVKYEYVDDSVFEIEMFETSNEDPDEYLVLTDIRKDGIALAKEGDIITFWGEHEDKEEFITGEAVHIFISNNSLETTVKIIE